MRHIIIYDLKDKNDNQRARILQKLYGHKDNSNYKYTYERGGFLDKLKYRKEKKVLLYFKDKSSLDKTSKILKELKVKFEIAYS